MKRIVTVMFTFLLLAVFSNAAITLTKGGKEVQIDKNAVVSTDGAEETVVNYNGFKITVPAGVKLVVRQDENGNIILNGANMAGVKLSNLIVGSEGVASVVVNPNTNTINVQEGNIQITNASGKTSAMRAGQTAMMVALPKQTAQTLTKEEQEAQEKAAKEKAKAEEKAAKEKAKQDEKAAKAKAKAEAKAAKEAAKAAKAEATQAGSTGADNDTPSFVDTTVTESAANQQATENIIEAEEDLSPSAPTL